MGCKQSKEEGPKFDKDVDVKRKLQVGLHLAEDEGGFQVAFCKTCRKKYGPTVVNTQTPTESQVIIQEPSSVETNV